MPETQRWPADVLFYVGRSRIEVDVSTEIVTLGDSKVTW